MKKYRDVQLHKNVKLNKKDGSFDNRLKKSLDKLIDLIIENEHVILSEYETNSKKILIDFKCGHNPHWMAPHRYKQGQSCPKCFKKNLGSRKHSSSRGEKIVHRWLKNNSIVYMVECTIHHNEENWRYDIYIPSINALVEIQGIQHYQFEKHFHKTYEKFEREKLNDYRKKRFAESLGYNYIEVDYRKGKPELSLARFLNQFNQYNLKTEIIRG
jgi:hypothetical protein